MRQNTPCSNNDELQGNAGDDWLYGG
ncbi:MAG: hypothetical protein F6J93_27365 [Oscillatoria sp. SIO1A7]|nr:hypothetical protein [Oscillatoria sp. SIO1A7]